MDVLALGLFLVSATALLGSPGPGITALVAVGRAEGFSRGLRYYTGLQVGLAAAAGASAAGLLSVLNVFPVVAQALTILATVYLLYLAYQIATSPVGSALKHESTASSPLAGLLLGIANPKAYLAFASLFASQTLVGANPQADVFLKWVLCVAVMIVVDLAWLLFGVALNQTTLRARSERTLNICLAVMIVAAAATAFH